MMDSTETILEAVKAGDVAKIKELLAKQPNLANARSERGESPVLLAAYYRRQEVLKFLLSSGAELNVYEASAVGDLTRLKALVAEDARLVNSFSPDGFTPLGLAAFFSHPPIVDFLLSRGASVNAVSRNSFSVMPLHSALAGRNLAIAKALVKKGADVNAKQQGGFTPLHGAADSGQEEMARLLLANGADVNVKAAGGETPFSIAVSKGYTAVADLLRRHGAAQ